MITRRLIILSILVGIALCFLESITISYVMNVPLWYLIPVRVPAIIPPHYGEMTLEVTGTLPLSTGETITVKVVDRYNGTSIEGAKIKVQRDGSESDLLTDKNGTTSFTYMGATTIITVSKEGYLDPEPKVIPKIPDSWIQGVYSQLIAWAVSGMTDFAINYYFYRKGRNGEHASRKTRRAR